MQGGIQKFRLKQLYFSKLQKGALINFAMDIINDLVNDCAVNSIKSLHMYTSVLTAPDSPFPFLNFVTSTCMYTYGAAEEYSYMLDMANALVYLITEHQKSHT